jgi:hypothetical protein
MASCISWNCWMPRLYFVSMGLAVAAGEAGPADTRCRQGVRPRVRHTVSWGHIEIGDQEAFGFVDRVLDYGGLVFEDDKA